MTISEALAYIHAVDWRGSKPGLQRIDALLEGLGHPERALKFIHVTGTNGKGSTCAMLASVLRAAGYRTGLYTSPYIFRFNERMQIDGEMISDEALCAVTEEVRPLADTMADHPSEFEMVTAIAFTWFARRHCDIVVCEVGMGGEFDATNVIPAPEAAVLCSIGLDHTQYLGGTVEEIAATKSGIIKSGCDAVLYPCAPSVAEVAAARCRSCGAALHPVELSGLTPRSHDLTGQVFDFGGLRELHLPLLGRMQLYNAATALTVVETLRRRGWRISDEAVRQGLAQVRWPVRFEVLHRQPPVVLDGGHNPQCMAALAENVRDYLPHRPLTVLTGVMRDKDYRRMYEALLPYAARFVTVTPDNPRALPAAELAVYLTTLGRPATAGGSIEEGAALALAQTPPDGALLCCGSLYLMGDAETALKRCLKADK